MGMMAWKAPSHEQPRGITILGSTGSVGLSTVDLIARDPQSYRVEALVAGNSVEALAEQARRLHRLRGGAHTEVLVRLRHAELLEEDLAEQRVVVLPGVHQGLLEAHVCRAG